MEDLSKGKWLIAALHMGKTKKMPILPVHSRGIKPRSNCQCSVILPLDCC
ncbi:hypothetical protein X975_16569, partial [Stegodyphus mimosarum]